MKIFAGFDARLAPTLLGVLLAAGCGQQSTTAGEETAPKPATDSILGPPPRAAGRPASATIEPKSDSGVTGVAYFKAVGQQVDFRIRIVNAPPGTHAVHLHEIGDCSSADGKSAGGHWNPEGVDHGRWGEPPFHRGDIGNLDVGDDGVGEMTLRTDLWTVGGAETTNVIGRAIIVHSGADDFTSQPTGAAGGRIACGVITAAR